MENSIIQNIDQKMVKTIDALKKDFVSIKAGRANPNILDNIFVDYYGSSMPINQLANITTPDSQLLVIVPWEKAATKEIEKSIIKANIGITPQNDGTVIRLPIPPLTGERRLELVKQVKKIVEECNSLPKKGEDAKKGDLLFGKGNWLDSRAEAVCAALGKKEIFLFFLLRV